MNYHNITRDDMLNGVALRVVLWVAGCNHNCKGCQNPITHDPNGGLPFTDEVKQELFSYLELDHIEGITFSGGDPLYPGNRDTILQLAKEVKMMGKTVWLYTGYTWEQIKDLEIVKYIDVLVDGRFVEELKDNKLKWKGSSNQRVIDVQKTLKQGDVVLFDQVYTFCYIY